MKKKMKVATAILMPLLLVLALVAPVAANGGVVPDEVNIVLPPDTEATVVKAVTTPLIPPNPDIYFLCDTTGSMGPVIAAMQTSAGAIMAAIVAAQPTAQFGVGNYRDYPDTVPPFTNQLAITSDTTAVSAAINAWSAGGGADWPEGQFYALDRLAEGAGIGWRGIGTKIVVWFGDAPGHDPVPTAATGLGYDITEASVTADLVAAGIKVIAISWDSGYPSPYPLGLDDDPTVGGGGYATAYGITENGNPGQASNIAAATVGAYLFAATPEEAVAAILAGIEQLTTDVWFEVTSCDTGLTVTLTPEKYLGVPGATTVEFEETISLVCTTEIMETVCATVAFYANSYPDTEGALIGTERICVTKGYLDIKPGSYPNAINTKAKGVIPVALLGHADFDVTDVLVLTLNFEGASPAHNLTDPDVYNDHLQDVNYDGYIDLVSHYRTKDTGIVSGQETACLTGTLDDGITTFAYCDSIKVLVKGKP